MSIRLARPEDSAPLLSIYQQYIHTPITFEYDLPSREEFAQRISSTLEHYPYLVWEEEGKLLGLPLNRCLHLEDTGEIYDIIAGTFLLCAAPPDSDRFESLTPEQITYYAKRFQHPEYFPAVRHD